MVKHLIGWEMPKTLKDCTLNVPSFPGANTKCMEDYKKSTMRDKPDHFILHVGTNDLNLRLSSESIGESM